MKRLKPIACLFLLIYVSTVLTVARAQSALHILPAPAQNRISENATRCFLKDRKGYIWVGTIDGLNRYDGYRFRTYHTDPRNPYSISGNYITDITEDAAGNIWVGTENGLNVYDPVLGGFRHGATLEGSPKVLAKEYVTDLLVDQQDDLWIATFGGFWRRLAGEHRFTRVKLDTTGSRHAIQHHDVTGLSQSLPDGFWIGYQNGRLSRYRDGQFIHYEGLGEEVTIHDLHQDQEGLVWLGTDHGVYRFDPTQNTFTKYLDHSTWGISGMNGKVWINANMVGVFQWDPQEQRLREVPIYLNNQQVFGDVKIFGKDERNIIWVSYHGLYKQDVYERRFTFYRHETTNPNSISEQFVGGIAENEQGNWMVLSINKGLNYYLPTEHKWLNYLTHPWYRNELVGGRSSNLQRYGQYYFVLSQGAVYRFDQKTGELRQFVTDREAFDFRGSLVVNDLNHIWMGGVNILKLDSKLGKFTDYTPEPISSKNSYYRVFRDDTGILWSICKNKLFRFYPETDAFRPVYQFGGSDPVFHTSIISCKRDQSGRFWIGRRNGLEFFDPSDQSFKHYSIADGLPSNTINCIEVDDGGKIWLGTNNGLSRFDPESETFCNFDRLDGIQDEIFLPNSSYQAADGRLFFGGVNGFNVFHPDSLVGKNPTPPRLLITDFKIFNESVVPGEQSVLAKPIGETNYIELSYKDASISFELLALGYSQPQKNECSYMIEGIDHQWNTARSGRTTIYHGLPRGETLYFKAKAANHDGIWGEPTVLRLYIRPPFWETGWFRLALFGFLLGTIFCYARLRIRSIRQRNLWLEKEVKKQTAEIEQQAADLQIANQQLKLNAGIIREKARQLDQLNKAQARFFISLSHEFRTPLTLLLGNLEALLQADKPGQVFEKISRRMQMSAQQLLQLINQLMDTAKLESGQYRLRVNKGALKEEIRGICSTFQVLAEKKQIVLQLEFQKADWQSTWYDSDILHKVLNNLLSNAVKFTEAGQITIRANILSDEAAHDGRTLLLIVSDTGIGIPKEQLPFVFDRFFQAEGPLSARKKGTGIGLSLVKQLVGLHKGQIQINSEKGKGTTFEVRLPIDRERFSFAERPDVSLEKVFPIGEIQNRLLPVKAEPPVTKTAGKQVELPLILVVDDNPDIRSFVVGQLKDRYSVKEAEDGAEAIQLAIKHLPDLIVSDVVMPNLNGFQLCDQLKTDQRTSHIPIILLTALAEQQQKLEGLKQGADAYLSKPFSREELILRISNLIDTREKLRRKFLREYSLDQLPDGLSQLDQNFLQRLQEVIDRHITDEAFGTEQLVRASGVSRTQLFRKLKSLTGMSASEFVRDFRLRKAYQLLHRDDLTVSEVIYTTGFNSRSYFYKAFKKKFGVAPSELKKV